MKNTTINMLIFVMLVLIGAVCYHSIEEIHYLKTFFPKTFTVEETFYAAWIEVIKVFLVSFPLLLVSVFLWKIKK